MMCLILIAHQIDRELPLLVLANRDEFYARATAPASFWPESDGLCAGRDLVGGGTWLGVRGGRWAAVTNVREGRREAGPGQASRGWLVRDYLCGDTDPATYLDQVLIQPEAYAGFNLLLGEDEALWYATNRDRARPRQLPPGLYGLSNHRLDTPWPKVREGKRRLGDWLAQAERHPARALGLLADRRVAADAELPATGVPLAWERALSAMFIRTAAYGTRSTTLFARGTGPGGLFQERTYHGCPQRWTERRFRVAG